MVQRPGGFRITFDERCTGEDRGKKLDIGDNQKRQGQKRGAFQDDYPNTRPRIVYHQYLKMEDGYTCNIQSSHNTTTYHS